MISFDTNTEDMFLLSLDEFGSEVADAVLKNLFEVAALLDWNEFAEDYAWREHVRDPIDTYPGANDMFKFTVPLPEGMLPPDDLVDVFCYHYQPAVLVICAVAH